jgi:hypothetical protein
VKVGLPATTEFGVKLINVGMGLDTRTVKVLVLVAVPPGVVTATRPEVALTGTTKVSVAVLTTVKLLTLVPFSITAVAAVRLVPVTVTIVPTRPLAGAKLSSVGAGVVIVNVAGAEVPPPGAGLVTVTLAVPAVATRVAGTWAVSWVADT